MNSNINIICNNCIGSRLYQINNIKFNNPFVWTLITIDDFVKLVTNYTTIDFNNIIISLEPNNHLKANSVLITIDNLVNIHCVHYIYDENYDTPGIKEGSQDKDVFFINIKDYAKDKYYNRLTRMNKSNFELIYSFNYQYLKLTNDEYINNFNKLVKLTKDGYKILIIMNDSCPFRTYCESCESTNLHIIWLNRWECTASHPSHYKKIQQEYNKFFNKSI